MQTLSGDKVVSGSVDCVIRIWDTNTGTCLSRMVGHVSPVLKLQLISNNKLVSVSAEEIKIWNLDNASCLKTLTNTA
jgi:F-box and WD-40 domain protein CDC4